MYPKIYLTTAAYPPIYNSGEIRYFAEIMAESGFRIDVVTPDLLVSRAVKDTDLDHDLEKDTPQIIIRRIPGLALFGLERSCSGIVYDTLAYLCLKNITQKEPGIVISFYPDVSSLSTGSKASAAAGIPFIPYLLENPFLKSGKQNCPVKRRTENRIKNILQNADAIIVTGKKLSSILKDKGINTPVYIIERGITGTLPEITLKENTKQMLLCLNCDSQDTDLDLLTKSFAMLKAYHPKAAGAVYLKCFGQRRKRVYRKLEPFEDERFFEYGSFITRDIENINLSRSDTGIIPLTKTFDKTVVPEAAYRYISFGLPYIISAESDSAASEFTRVLQCGIVIPPDNPAALSGAVLELVSDRKKYTCIRERQLQIRESLLFSRSKSRFFELFSNLQPS
ncbi:MAG: glycosyltransferase family protein [Planctomycetota bacterium]|jgi:glycosyltransferase involved in cell wall biosynthesis